MIVTIELIPDPDEGGFTARLPDIPAYGEGATEDEAIADLKEALAGYVETFGLDDAWSRKVLAGVNFDYQPQRHDDHEGVFTWCSSCRRG